MNDRMYIERINGLYDIHPSLCLTQSMNNTLVKRIVDIAVSKKLPFHLWFHLWNFGDTKELIQRTVNRLFIPIFEYAKEKEKNGTLVVETMSSAARKIEMMSLSL